MLVEQTPEGRVASVASGVGHLASGVRPMP